MTEEKRHPLYPAASVFRGRLGADSPEVARIISMMGPSKRELISQAEGFKPPRDLDGQWQLFAKGEFIGYADDEEIYENLDLLTKEQKRNVCKILNDREDVRNGFMFTGRDLVSMAIGAGILGAAALISRLL